MPAKSQNQTVKIRDGLTKQEAQLINDALSGLSSDGAVWRALMLLIDVAASDAIKQAIQPNITNDSRNFNAGRATMLPDFKRILQAAQQAQIQPQHLA